MVGIDGIGDWLNQGQKSELFLVTQGVVQKPLRLLCVRYSDGAEDKVLRGDI